MTDYVDTWKRTVEDERCWVSDRGNIIGVRGELLKPGRGGDGYYTVNLAGKTRKVAHVVARAFIGERPHGYELAHLDGNTANNALDNLAYVTKPENESHKIIHGTSVHGERNGRAKLSDDAVKLIRTLLENGWTQVQVAERFNITQGHVSAIKRGTSR